MIRRGKSTCCATKLSKARTDVGFLVWVVVTMSLWVSRFYHGHREASFRFGWRYPWRCRCPRSRQRAMINRQASHLIGLPLMMK